MGHAYLDSIHEIKISCFSKGIRITERAKSFISQNGKFPLTIHEYATTGGVTFRVLPNTYINAPFDEWYCENPDVILDFDHENLSTFVNYNGKSFPVEIFPLPGYLDLKDSCGRLVTDTVMSHVDRIRISPISGCSFRCSFCDYFLKRYEKRPVDQIIEGLSIALKDCKLPAKHILISGGTPKPEDRKYLEDIFERIIKEASLPVDVMVAPWSTDLIDRLAEWGVYGFSINLELFSEDALTRFASMKNLLGRKQLAKCIEQAIKHTGGKGRVRSLLIAGLEPINETLNGVRFLAEMGCDPVISPFRPALGTTLSQIRPPDTEMLTTLYLKSLDIVEKYNVQLGPRCIPCQHNTLTFPENSSDYYFS